MTSLHPSPSVEDLAAPRQGLGISVVIPVKHGGDVLRRCLEGIVRQEVDDDRAFGARVHEIPPERFNHGGTRNLGASLAAGELLVFLSQDAEPLGTDWLRRLVEPLRRDPGIAGVYGRQIAHPDAKPPERFFLEFLYGPSPKVQRAATRDELSMQTTLFSNANSVIRHELLERFPFVEDIIMSEDQEWSRRVVLEGYAIC